MRFARLPPIAFASWLVVLLAWRLAADTRCGRVVGDERASCELKIIDALGLMPFIVPLMLLSLVVILVFVAWGVRTLRTLESY